MITNKNISEISIYLFIILLFCLPLSIEREVLNTGSKLLFFTEPICALLTISCGAYLLKNRQVKVELTKIDWLTITFLLSVLFSTLFSDSYLVSIKYTVSLIWYFSAGYLVIRCFDFTKFQVRASIIAFFAGTSLLAAYVCYNMATKGIFHETSYDLALPFIEQGHTDLTVVVEPALFMGIIGFLIIPWSKKRTLIILGICCSMFLALILYSISKASYIAVALSISALGLIILLKNPKTLLKLSYIIIPIILILVIWKINNYLHFQKVKDDPRSHYNSGGENYDPNDPTTYKNTDPLDEIFNKSTDTTKNGSNVERLNRLTGGLYMYQSHPSFGIGMGTFPEKYLEFVPAHPELIKEAERTYDIMNSHNIYLSWLVEGGLITLLSGIGILILAFQWCLTELTRKKGSLFIKRLLFTYLINFNISGFIKWYHEEFPGKKANYIKAFLLIYLISFTIHGLIHDFGQNPRVIIPFWISIAIISKQMALKKRVETEKSSIIKD